MMEKIKLSLVETLEKNGCYVLPGNAHVRLPPVTLMCGDCDATGFEGLEYTITHSYDPDLG